MTDRIGGRQRLRRAGTLLLALAAAAIFLLGVRNWHNLLTNWLPAGPLRDLAMQPGVELAFKIILLTLALLAIVWVIRQVVHRASRAAVPYLGVARAQTLATFATFICYLLLVPLVAWAAGIDLTGLALPTALTGVVIAITAQASLGNLIAGLVILFTRPYVEGMSITARAPGLVGGEYSGLVTHIGLFFTVMRVDEREVRLPNSALVQSTVIVRSQEVEVYVPVVLAPATEYETAIAGLRRELVEALPPRRTITLVLERIDAAGYAVGVHASVATLAEQHTVGATIARYVAGMIVLPAPAAASGPPAGSAGAIIPTGAAAGAPAPETGKLAPSDGGAGSPHGIAGPAGDGEPDAAPRPDRVGQPPRSWRRAPEERR
jgi:hypothetical protein